MAGIYRTVLLPLAADYATTLGDTSTLEKEFYITIYPVDGKRASVHSICLALRFSGRHR